MESTDTDPISYVYRSNTLCLQNAKHSVDTPQLHGRQTVNTHHAYEAHHVCYMHAVCYACLFLCPRSCRARTGCLSRACHAHTACLPTVYPVSTVCLPLRLPGVYRVSTSLPRAHRCVYHVSTTCLPCFYRISTACHHHRCTVYPYPPVASH